MRSWADALTTGLVTLQEAFTLSLPHEDVQASSCLQAGRRTLSTVAWQHSPGLSNRQNVSVFLSHSLYGIFLLAAQADKYNFFSFTIHFFI